MLKEFIKTMIKTSVGVDIGGTKMLMHSVINTKVFTKKMFTGMHISVSQIESEIVGFIKTLPADVQSIGIAIPGLVDKNSNSVRDSDVIPGLNGWAGKGLIAKGYSILFLNDISAGLLSECYNEETEQPVLLVMSGTGIGAAIQIGKDQYFGANGWSGELGKMIIMNGDEPKSLDEMASGARLLNKTQLNLELFIDKYEKSDEKIIKDIRESGKVLGIGLANAVHFFDPGVLILGGGMFRFDEYWEGATESLFQYLPAYYQERLVVRKTKDGELTVAKGAFLSVREQK